MTQFGVATRGQGGRALQRWDSPAHNGEHPAWVPNQISLLRLFAFLVAHVPLALLMYQFRLIATLHALVTVGIGLVGAASRQPLQRATYAGAYITGAEVLWRMTGASVFWECGKYATAAIFLVAMLRSRRLTVPGLPVLYFVLLLPSTLLTIMNRNPDLARADISSNLSGPFALMVSAWFFSQRKRPYARLNRVFLMVIGPLVGIASLALFSAVTAAKLRFSDNSNFATSGGYGPNQVSSILGLGAMLAFLYTMDSRASRSSRALMFALMLWLAAQGAFTFSRGGLYCAGTGIALASLYLARDARSRVRMLLVISFFSLIGYSVLLPRLDALTGGALARRLADTRTTGRDRIARADLEIWQENPMFGVGPGRSRSLHAMEFRAASAHTEPSRLLAEHGSLGAAALLLLVIMGVRNLRRAPTPMSKAVVAALLGWSAAFMLSAAMRVVAPAFVFGLTFATFLPEENGVAEVDPNRGR